MTTSRILANVRSADEAARAAYEQLDKAVHLARIAGHTWAELGEVLGITRQAVQQRFGE